LHLSSVRGASLDKPSEMMAFSLSGSWLGWLHLFDIFVKKSQKNEIQIRILLVFDICPLFYGLQPNSR
jgi:hypothetical protein